MQEYKRLKREIVADKQRIIKDCTQEERDAVLKKMKRYLDLFKKLEKQSKVNEVG